MDWMSIATIIGSVFGSSVLSTFIQTRSNKKTSDATADATVADSASRLVETMRTDLDGLKLEMRELRAENLMLQKRVFELEGELKVYRSLSATPTSISVPHS